MLPVNARLIPRYNWDYGMKEMATAFGSILGVVSGKENVWEEQFGKKPVLTTSGRASLYTIMRGLELPKGSGVGVPLFCCPVVFDAVRQAGQEPIFLDINGDDYNVSAEDTSSKIKKLSAIVMVHMFGQPADMDSLSEICRDIPVIEDCAQALFSEYKGNRVGFGSTASFFSFRSGKYISAGEGSAIFCRDKELHDKIETLVYGYEGWRWDRQIAHGASTYIKSKFYRRPLYGLVGYPIGRALDRKLNLTSKSGFELRKIAPVDRVIIEKRLEHFKRNVDKQRDNAKYLSSTLNMKSAVFQGELEGRRSNCYQFPVRFKEEERRNIAADHLFRRGIDCARYLDDIIPTARESYGYAGDCPVAEQSSKTVLSIPIHYTMSKRDLERIGRALNEADAMAQ